MTPVLANVAKKEKTTNRNIQLKEKHLCIPDRQKNEKAKTMFIGENIAKAARQSRQIRSFFVAVDSSDYQIWNQSWEYFGCVCFRNNNTALPVQPLGSRAFPTPALSVHRILHAQKPCQTTQHKEEVFSATCPCSVLSVNKGICAALVVFMVLSLW